eukprot:m.181276 g.181276  ORF g.181276 m.181276 type:complete len:91 (+) comp18447_c0_seq1:315-587(+)
MTADGAGEGRGPQVNAIENIQRFVIKHAFFSGIACGIILAKMTFRNAVGASFGTLGGLWYQQEHGAPRIDELYHSVETEVLKAMDGQDRK